MCFWFKLLRLVIVLFSSFIILVVGGHRAQAQIFSMLFHIVGLEY